jgi:hypothetical protein
MVALAVLVAFVAGSVVPSFAESTAGGLTGSVSTDDGHNLRGVAVSAVAPSGRYQTTTDERGFYSIVGMVPDTYTVSFTLNGYEPFAVRGVTVGINQTVTVSEQMHPVLQTIGRTQARSTSSAFQPQQTADTYTVGTQAITTITGKTNNTNEVTLLASLPGASFDSTGYPVLRGGRENEEGYQYEGIDYTDAFTTQFTNSLLLHGESQFQVTPGAGDASTGNAGTGSINLVAKRGTNPRFGQFEADLYNGTTSEHTFNGEYGWATPNGRFSSYSTALIDRIQAFKYGPGGTTSQLLGDLTGARANQWANDVLENMVYKFGRDNSQSLQLFYNNTMFEVHLGNGLVNQPNGLGYAGFPLYYKSNDPLYLHETQVTPGLNLFSPAQIQALIPFFPGQTSVDQQIGSRYLQTYNQPQETLKLQYSWNVNSSTFLTAKAYLVNSVNLQDFPNTGGSPLFTDINTLTGGITRGVALDGTKQLGTKNLLAFGGSYKFLYPVFSQATATGGLGNVAGYGQGLEALDFLPNDANCPFPGACGYLLGNNPTGTHYVPAGTRVPLGNQSGQTTRQDWALYVQDTFSPTSRLKINAGLRLDAANWQYTCSINNCLPTSTGTYAPGTMLNGVDVGGQPNPALDAFNYDASTRRPRVLEPRLSVVDQFGKNDSVRLSYARSVQFPSIAYVDKTNNFAGQYTPFRNVPSFDVTTGAPAVFCGTTNDRPCKSYADQLLWANESGDTGLPVQPLKPVTFINYELSYSHLFAHNVALKLTPFYRKAFDEIAASATPLVRNGQIVTDAFGAPQFGPTVETNLGNSKITGVEFYMTKESPYGLSGQLSLTYQNEFTNVLPTSPSENFFPSIPTAAIQLGNSYRVGSLSPFVGTLALSYKTHSGWRFNPTVYYNHGYPYGAGLLSAFTVNDLPYNLPNTNVTNSGQLGGAGGATRYVDPTNPGSLFAPNVAATRGTPESASPGGVLTKSSFSPQMSIEYTPPSHPRNTFGVLVTNLFNVNLSSPALNPLFQPVATGRGAPYSGYTSLATNPAYFQAFNFTSLHGNLPYYYGVGIPGRQAQFYYQLSF